MRLCSVHGANSMCSASKFKTRPSWLPVLSPDGVEWLWKSALTQPRVSTVRKSDPRKGVVLFA